MRKRQKSVRGVGLGNARLSGLIMGALLVAVAAVFVAAPSVAETTPPRNLAVEDAVLVLNGHGTREELWTDIYDCALYLPEASANLRYIFDPATPKAVRIRVLYDDIPERMPDEWRAMFRSALSPQSYTRLRQAYGQLRQGDVLVVSYAPDRGTQIAVNEQPIVDDAGHGLIDVVLRQWLGDDPVSEDLQRRLLNYNGRAA